MVIQCPHKCHIWSTDTCCRQQRVETRTQKVRAKIKLEQVR